MKRRGLVLATILLVAFAAFSQIITIPSDFTTIQAGINAASDGDTVLVEEGTYIENINFRGKAITVASQFILDGDTSHISKTVIDGSEPVYPDSASTVTMLLARDTTSVLCGFTIQGGSGTGPFGYPLDDQITSYAGGGIIHAGGKIINNIIRNNHVSHVKVAAGGGISGGEVKDIISDTGVNIVIRDNIITQNNTHTQEHYSAGAGIQMGMDGRFTLIENNIIYMNTSTTDAPYKAFGGGMNCGRMTSSTGKAIIRNNYIHHNEVHSEYSFGGGMFYLLLYDTPVTDFHPVDIYNNVISSNHTDYRGGGACFWYLGIWGYKPPLDPVLSNNTIIDNFAKTGSGICAIDAEIALFNNILWNEAALEGGLEISDEVFEYCAPTPPAWCRDKNYAIFHAAYNNVKGEYEGIGNINQDPMLDPDSFSPDESSPCVGRATDSVLVAGTWHYAPESDFNGVMRLMASADIEIDMGALESPYERPKTGYDSKHVINVPEEESSIQAAIDAAVDGDTVLVEEGVYYENIFFNGKAITVASSYIVDNNETHIAQTVIDGSQPSHPDTASVVSMISGEDSTSVLKGFTITGGTGTKTKVFFGDLKGGGGINILNSGGKIENNIITKNHVKAEGYSAVGGGIVADPDETASNIIIRNNLIFENSVESNSTYAQGGGILAGCASGITLLENNMIHNNTATCTGVYKGNAGGLMLFSLQPWNATLIVRNNIIRENEVNGVASHGGGIFLTYPPFSQPFQNKKSGIEIYNNLITGNYCEEFGGGLSFWDQNSYGDKWLSPSPLIYNNTIVGNKSAKGAGIHNFNSRILLFNNIIWNDLSSGATEIYNGDLPPYPLAYSKVNDGIVEAYYNIIGTPFEADDHVIEANNTYMDPILESGASFELLENSPAVGRGTDSVEIEGTWYHAPRLDFLGRERPGSIDPHVDPGAFESPFSRLMLSTADLVSIDMTGTKLIPPFQSNKLKYILRMPENFDYVNDLIAIPEDGLAEMEVNHATDILSENIDDRTTTITVTSSDGTASKIYKVEFRPLSTDASLSALSVSQGSLDPAFDPGIFTYEVLLPTGTTEVPTISYITSNEHATVEVTDAQDLTHSIAPYRTSHVEVTAQDEMTIERYKIVFRVVGVGFDDLNNAEGLSLFPNPFSTSATLEWKAERSVQRIELVNMLGKIVREEHKIDGNTITLNRGDLPSGLYFLKIHGDETLVMKVLID